MSTTYQSQDLGAKAAEFEAQFSAKENELLGPIFGRVDAAIKGVAKSRQLDLVLRTRTDPGQPIILYANGERLVDITQDVAKELGLEID